MSNRPGGWTVPAALLALVLAAVAMAVFVAVFE